MSIQTRKRKLVLFAALSYLAVACATSSAGIGDMHRWWAGLGPVLPHDTFPADCSLCHTGSEWRTLRDDFSFDHAKETGVALIGAHAKAQCLRCHNDRGPIEVFNAKGCLGCHEDIHYGELGKDCTYCHTQKTWQPVGQIELHNRTRFPLVGAHMATSCSRCHPGAFVGKFVPTPIECDACHANDAANTNNPPHLALGWVDNCNRCHMPTRWTDANN